MNTSTGANVAQQSELNLTQIRGVWHRPNSSERETNLEELCVVLDEFKEAGINLVFLETFFHSSAIFKSEKVAYREKLACYDYGKYPDYFTAFIEEAEKRGIGVHAWVQDFYVGVDEDKDLIINHPDWMLINQDGKIRHTTEGAGFGVDTNVITLITKEETAELPLQSKEDAADAIIDKALELV